MANAPLTQTQLPLEAILDIFGKQTYLGNSFTLPAPGVSLSDENEDVVTLIENPSTSGKSFFIFSSGFMSNNNPLLMRLYLKPTVTSAGSATAAINLRSGATTTSVSKCYLGASISANGTLLTVLPANTSGMSTNLLIVLDPGTNLLITGQQAASGTSLALTELAWYEI